MEFFSLSPQTWLWTRGTALNCFDLTFQSGNSRSSQTTKKHGNVPGLRCTTSLCAGCLSCSLCIPRHWHASSKNTLFGRKYSQTTHYSLLLAWNYSDLVRSLQDSVKDTGLWIEENKPKMNKDQTEAIRFSSSLSSVNTTIQHPKTISFSNTDAEFVGIVRNLGFTIDRDLSVKQHIIQTCKAAYSEIRHISCIRQYLTEDAAKTQVSSYILSRLNDSSSLLAGYTQTVIKPLQQVQNSAAKLILKFRRAQHAKSLLKH